MARRRLTKVARRGMGNGKWAMEGNCDLQVKTVTCHSSGGTPLGKPLRFVVARQRPRTDIAHNLACDYAAQVWSKFIFSFTEVAKSGSSITNRKWIFT